MSSLRLSDFDYDLPRELIAQVPAPERTGSRLLHVDGAALADLAFTDLPRLVAPGDLLVLNDTRVIKSRLAGDEADRRQGRAAARARARARRALFQLRASHPPKSRQRARACGRRARDRRRSPRSLLRAAPRMATCRSSTISTVTAPCRCRRTSRARPKPTTRRATRRSSRARRAPSPRRPRACTSTRRSLPRSKPTASPSPASRCTSAPARSRRSRPRISPRTRCIRSGIRFPVPLPQPSRQPRARRPRPRRRHDDRARARIRRGTRRARARRRRRNAALHHAGLRIPRRRPAAHQFPSAEVDAADARVARSPAWRRFAPPTRTRSRQRYRFFSYGDAMLLERAREV